MQARRTDHLHHQVDYIPGDRRPHLQDQSSPTSLNCDLHPSSGRVAVGARRAALNSANNLAIRLAELGEREQARALDEDTLTRRRRILGEDHPDTLISAHNLAVELAELGEHEQAREVEDWIKRHRGT